MGTGCEGRPAAALQAKGWAPPEPEEGGWGFGRLGRVGYCPVSAWLACWVGPRGVLGSLGRVLFDSSA